MAESDIHTFCRQIRARSAEHREAITLLRSLPGQVFSILRQELDSLIRVIFILSQQDRTYRNQLMRSSVTGGKWFRNGTKSRITDKDMVDLSMILHGWTQSVYRFGCGFIHLSNMHDYKFNDPFTRMPQEEREAIITHLKYYHGGPNNDNPTLNDIIPLLPQIYEKIAANLECYVETLESDGDLDKD